jgi:hypothetical protein
MLESLIISATENTPSVFLDKKNGKFIIEGKCLFEDTQTFFEPVLNWIESYAVNPNPITHFEFNLKYFNISGSKSILSILYKLRELQLNANEIKVTWYYTEDEMQEFGEDFAFLLKIPFEFIKKTNHMPADEFILETIAKSN